MNKIVKVIIALAAIAAYFVVLRYLAPVRQPYFILGIALIGFIAWLYGTLAGLLIAVLLIPITLHIYSLFPIKTPYDTFFSTPAYIALEIFTVAMLGRLRKKTMILSQKEADLEEANERMITALAKVREFGGVHSLCTSCKKILDEDGNWKRIDTYLKEKTKAEFSHGVCPDCVTAYEEPVDDKTVISVP